VPVAVFGVVCGIFNVEIITGTIKHCKMGPEIKKIPFNSLLAKNNDCWNFSHFKFITLTRNMIYISLAFCHRTLGLGANLGRGRVSLFLGWHLEIIHTGIKSLLTWHAMTYLLEQFLSEMTNPVVFLSILRCRHPSWGLSGCPWAQRRPWTSVSGPWAEHHAHWPQQLCCVPPVQ